jgi:hypothetical protein
MVGPNSTAKEEGMVEKKALSVALQELAELQSLQKKSVKVGNFCFSVWCSRRTTLG